MIVLTKRFTKDQRERLESMIHLLKVSGVLPPPATLNLNPCPARPVYTPVSSMFRSIEISLILIKQFLLDDCMVNPIIQYLRSPFFININTIRQTKQTTIQPFISSLNLPLSSSSTTSRESLSQF